MIKINLFQIPCFLKKSDVGRELLSKSNEFQIGSKEWIYLMSDIVLVPIFAKSDEINNIGDFANLIEVCEYWGIPYTASIFIYFTKYNHECNNMYFLSRYLNLYNKNFNDVRELYNIMIN